jgi:SET domain-containing protein
MTTNRACSIALLLTVILFGGDLSWAGESAPQRIALLKIDQAYERKTAIRKSAIPNAGNGLYALTKIKKGEIIGELGGRLVTDSDPSLGNHYIAAIPECAWKESSPYKYIDSKEHGGHVSRINFAPSKINGSDTNLQSAAIKQLCHPPYFIFVAVKDIEPGTEIWSSYGPHYDYEPFMKTVEVRDFFCGLAKIDCRKKFDYAY